MRDALERAMGHEPDDQALRQLQDGGLTMVNVDTVSQAIHDVYCGIMADHEHPNEKDRNQAVALIAALQRQSAEPVGTGDTT
jgi:hypothetical protein